MWHLDRLCSNAQASSSSSRPHGDASTSAWGTGFSMCMASMRQRRMVRALVASGPHVRSRKCSRTTGSKDSFPSRDELPGSPAAARAPATSSRSRDTRHSTDQRAAHGARRVAAAAVLSPPLLVRPQPPPQQQKPKPAPASERVTAPQPPQASERPSTGQHKQRGSHSRQHSSSADIREAPHGAASSQESSRSPHRQRMPGGDVRATTASRSATSCPSPPDMLLSQYLKSCQSWRELQEAVARAGPDALNHIHLTAVASGLAKMAPGPQADSAEHAAFARCVSVGLRMRSPGAHTATTAACHVWVAYRLALLYVCSPMLVVASLRWSVGTATGHTMPHTHVQCNRLLMHLCCCALHICTAAVLRRRCCRALCPTLQHVGQGNYPPCYGQLPRCKACVPVRRAHLCTWWSLVCG